MAVFCLFFEEGVISLFEGKRIGFIGAGAMAEAMLAGILGQKLVMPEQIFVTNRSNQQRLQQLQQRYALPEAFMNRDEAFRADIVILATKPKDVPPLLEEWPSSHPERQLFISVAAGLSTERIEQCFSNPVAVVRAMPNTSSQVGESATAICQGSIAAEQDVAIAEQIFSAMGKVVQVREQQIDAVTGLSGSGPAYLYYIAEALEQAGVEAGLSAEEARLLTVQTFVGAAKMLSSSGKDAKTLRQEVTSPNGTTMAGLEQLAQGNVATFIGKAVKAAKKRSIKMGEELTKK